MATDVYYSISPFGTGDIKVASNISIAGGAGVATFSVAQTGNIGVGTHVISANIDGYISVMTNSTTATIVTALGVAHGNVTSESLTSISHEYASLVAFEAGFTDANHVNNTDLTAVDVVANAPCYYDHVDQTPDSSPVTFNFGITDTTRYVKVYTPQGGTESINNQRHDGKWNINRYHMSINNKYPFGILEQNTIIEGIQLDKVSVENTGIVLSCGALNITLNKCIIRQTGTSTGDIGVYGTENGFIVINCVVVGIDSVGIQLFGDSVVLNNTVSNCTTGIFRQGGTVNAINNASFNNTDDFSGTFNSLDYNASDDGDGTNAVDISPGGTEADDWNAAFTDYINGDFSVKDSVSVLFDAGTDLSGSGIIDDIIGTARPESVSYDIGVFELIIDAVPSVNLDALLKTTITKSFSLDTLLQKTVPINLSLDTFLQVIKTNPVLLESILRKLNITDTVSLDVLLSLLDIQTTLSLDSLLEQENITLTTALDVVLVYGLIEISLDVLLKKNNVLMTISLDSFIQKVNTETLSLETILQASLIKTLLMDTLIQKTNIININLDTITNKIQTAILTFETILQKQDQKLILLDTVLNTTNINTLSLDTLLFSGRLSTLAINTILQKTILKNVPLEALLIKTKASVTLLDAVIFGVLISTKSRNVFRVGLRDWLFEVGLQDWDFVVGRKDWIFEI